MTSPTEILETIVLHVDAGGSLLRTSPIVAMASVDPSDPDPAAQTLAEILRDMRGENQPCVLTSASPLVARARSVLSGDKIVATIDAADEARGAGGPSLDAPIELPADDDEAICAAIEGLGAGSLASTVTGVDVEVIAAGAETYDPNGVYMTPDGGTVLVQGNAPQPIMPTGEALAALLRDGEPSILDLPHGLHLGVAPSIYHARVRGVVSKTVLDLVAKTPAHLLAWYEGAEQEETGALFLGSATHCAVLEPERFAVEYAVEPDFGDCRKTDRTTTEDAKANKTRRDEWRAKHEGATLLSAEDAKAVAGMAASVHRHPMASRMLRGGVAEATVRWRDEVTGLEAKARPDYYRADIGLVVDLKTTADASPQGFARSIAKWRYGVQAALYMAGLEAVGCRVERERFVFLAVEKTAPYACALYTLSGDALLRGRLAVAANMATLAECLERDVYPGYDPGIVELELPPWAT